MHVSLTSSSSSLIFSSPTLCYMMVNPGYDAKKLYEYSKKILRIDLVYPIERYKSTLKKILDLYIFLSIDIGWLSYSQRRMYIGPR